MIVKYLNNKIKIILFLFVAFGILINASCKKEKQDEQENLNVLKVKIGANTFTWSDTDGPGGTAPKIDTIKLTPNGSFPLELTVQDGSTNPAKDFTTEIVAEKDDHIFVFKPTGNLTINSLSKDSKGKDFGHTGTVATTAAGTGSLRILLIHLPDKTKADPSTTGETDLDVTLPVVIR